MMIADGRSIGLCLGASTITAVRLSHGDGGFAVDDVVVRPHEGNPREVVKEVLDGLEPGSAPIMATGRKFRQFVALPSIVEPEAVELALAGIRTGPDDRYDAVVSLGGETFMVYGLDHEQRVKCISTGNKCASGTGEFFLQQIRRMDLTVEEAVELAAGGKPYAVSGRCSVFCKSDCTHALNKGEPVANVTAGLCRMIANKIVEILAKVPHDRVLLVGGTAQNAAVAAYLREQIPEVVIPREAPWFEALGAALFARSNGRPLNGTLLRENTRSFVSLEPLEAYADLVSFETIDRVAARDDDECVLGLDVGSTTTKAVLLRKPDHGLVASVYLRTNGNPIEASRACLVDLRRQLGDTRVRITGFGVTGSGRQIAGLYALTEGVVNEIIAHARAAAFFDERVDTIVEIGGQDAKYTYLVNGVASDYAMNEACSAGTGSFLEESAKESLGVPMEDIAELALRGRHPPNFSDQCAAFISSDIKNATHEGLSKEDVLAGLVYSICFNYVNRVKGNRPTGETLFMQGGVCYNRAVPLAMAGILGRRIVVPPEPGLMGAFGVALEVEDRIAMGLVSPSQFDLGELIARDVVHKEPFVCAGGREKCDLKCSVSRIQLEGQIYPFGGACNRYYAIHRQPADDHAELDYVARRQELMFGTYAPKYTPSPSAPVVGVNRSFMTERLFPLYHAFFRELGCALVLPDGFEPTAVHRQVTSMCYPTEVAIGQFDDLIRSKRPDFVFMPYVKEMYVPNGIDRLDFCSTCGFSAGEAFWTRQAYADRPEVQAKILSPYANFNGGWEKGEAAFLETAERLGFSAARGRAAFKAGIEALRRFDADCQRMGREALDRIHADEDAIGIVLFGRAYNAYAPEANKGIPKKVSSRRLVIVPYDFLPYADGELDPQYRDYMHWEAGQKILKAARLVERDPQLYGLFITNFLCAPDSFLVSFFRTVMGTKPSLTLELDHHTADAGINTRIDAFADVINNYRAVRRVRPAPAPAGGFVPAQVSVEHKGTYYVDSARVKRKLTDPEVRFLIPPMGEYGSRALAAAIRRIGIEAFALPTADAEVLRLGRAATTCKECIPMILIIGALIKYLRDRGPDRAGEKVMLLVPKAAGYCRLGQYHVAINQYIQDHRIPDVALLNLGAEEQFAGLGPKFTYWAWQALMITDVLDDVECSLVALAVDKERALAIFDGEWAKIFASLEGRGEKLFRQLEQTAQVLAAIPLKQRYDQTAHVCLTGEFYVRKDPFSNLGLARRIAEQGFLVSTTAVTELMYYANYAIKQKMVQPKFTFFTWLEFRISDLTQRYLERRIKRILAKTRLFTPEITDIPNLIRHAAPILPKEFPGEPGLIAGLTMHEGLTRYCGIVNVGPFGCMQMRIADAITIPNATVAAKAKILDAIGHHADLSAFHPDDHIPFLSVESDGNPYPQLLEARFESFLLQAERVACKQGKIRASQQAGVGSSWACRSSPPAGELPEGGARPGDPLIAHPFPASME